jgi:hypothetical protein
MPPQSDRVKPPPAAGVADAVAGEETASFAHTVLVDFRARLRRSEDPDRIFRVTCTLARQLGLVGVKRVLDSAPLEDAVTTQDTVTMLTPRPASRPVTGPTGPLGRRWWTPWSAMPTGPTMPCAGSGWTHEPLRRPCCWPP